MDEQTIAGDSSLSTLQTRRSASTIRIWIHGARPKTLPAGAAPVLMGTALAYGAGAFHAAAAAAALVSALLIQVGTNYANDYQDFLKGADTAQRKGPLRITQAGLATPGAVRRAAIVAFALAVVAGLYLIYRGGWPVLLIGVLSIAFGALYTGGRYSLAYLGIADFFVLVFFGPVAVAGTFYVQAVGAPGLMEMLPVAVVAGLAPGALAVSILLANNIRDAEEDALAGKRTLVVRFGRGVGVVLYLGCFVAAALVPIILWAWTRENALAVAAGLIVLPIGIASGRVLRHSRRYEETGPVLGRSATALMVFSVAFTLGWVLS